MRGKKTMNNEERIISSFLENENEGENCLGETIRDDISTPSLSCSEYLIFEHLKEMNDDFLKERKELGGF